MRTTISPYGFGTSFTKDGQEYFVSTAESPPNSRRFETIIKVLGKNAPPFFCITSTNPRMATSTHIALVRMATSLPTQEWSINNTASFTPDILRDELDKQGDITDADYCLMLLKMAGLEYSTTQGSKACFIATACFESGENENVMRLRRYRDLILKKSYLGKQFVYFYYKLSPPIARYISDKPKHKKIISNLLKKLLKTIYKKHGI